MDLQLGLFPETSPATPTPKVRPVEPSADARALATEIPESLRLGTSSWSFPGWHGIVYDRPAAEAALAKEGLAAYAVHPLLRAVCIDRSYYRSLTADQFRAYAQVVPGDFRFVVKADRLLTSPIDPGPGGIRSRNSHFLDGTYAAREVIGPLMEGLEEKAGPVLFQFPPFPVNLVGGRRPFLRRLRAFFLELPEGLDYAVELRTPALLTEEYGALLEAVGAAHCYNVHPAMSSLRKQLELLQPFYQPVVLVRWMLHAGLGYEDARTRYQPFDRLVDEDLPTRELVARAIFDGLLGERSAFVIANNKAEGSAPLTLFRLAEHLARWGTEER